MKILVFAGTSEGKAVSIALAQEGHHVTATVATDYGRDVFLDFFASQGENITTLEGRLNIEEMRELIRQNDLVFDATHPFATEVSKNILAACKLEQKSYIRIVRDAAIARDSSKFKLDSAYIIYAKNQSHAIEIMNTSTDKVMLTTGSKDLVQYRQVKDYEQRLYPRILPDQASLDIAETNGYKRSNIICMQGPFTAEVNAAMLKMTGAKYLLTKETGQSGGFYEKLEACKRAGAKAIVIARPQEAIDKQEEKSIETLSCTVTELKAFLEDQKIQDRNFTVKDLQKFVHENISEDKSKSKHENINEQEITSRIQNKKNQSQKNSAESRISSDAKKDENYTESHKERYRFPIFIDLQGKTVTVIGSGKIAQRRIQVLLDYGAHVRVISPQVFAQIEFEHTNLEKIERAYNPGDLKGSIIAIAATNDRQTNQAVAEEGKQEKIFVSIADCKEESSFYFPAVWTGKELSMGIVGNGQNHPYVKKSVKQIKTLINEIKLEDEDEEN